MVLWIPSRLLEFRIRGFHPLSLVFPGPFCYPLRINSTVRTPECSHSGLGSSAFARRYLRNRYYFLFLRLLRCFSSPGSPRIPMYSVYGDRIAPAGFPHSDISGSLPVCGSPKLFAAYHVFHRLSVPRHPPCALISFTYRFSFEIDLLSCCLYQLAY